MTDPYNTAKPLTPMQRTKKALARGERLGASHDVQLPRGRYVVGSLYNHAQDYNSGRSEWTSNKLLQLGKK
jgi:hypothetical protein